MQYHTHLAFSGMVGLSMMDWAQVPDPTSYFFGLAIGALLPDIDHPKSKISNKVPILPSIISRFFTHRTFFHSLLFVGILTFLYGLLPASLVTGIIFGTASHILGDMLTPAGVKLFYPFGLYIRLPLTFKTGGSIEQICFFTFIFISYKLIS
ncbi:metal-dependent hydrolase [Bacillus sp. SCS-151]|uniref:metal-dependent hydrolase n=1 Tax=Nanhaiella sioensis TaxID=3115293 RepID=UPI00397AD075